ncbi:MAG: nucleotide exchange factor GrpE [Anaerolineae bacterium]|nr:nucleotide exchange factor GrpE [Anaerolineae bacterium]
MSEETLDKVSKEPEMNDVSEGEKPGDNLEDVPCLDTDSVEEELNCLDDTVSSLEEKLADVERQAAEYLDGWQRTQASFANYRKRTEAEQVHWRGAANANLLGRLIPILDDFQRAFDALPDEFQGHPWLNGITLIQRKIRSILDSESVTTVELNPGDAFDPLYHQAVVYQEVEGFEDGQIVAVVEKGYLLGERVLRPAMVVVAKVPASARKEADKEKPIESTDDVIEGEIIASDDEETGAEKPTETDTLSL